MKKLDSFPLKILEEQLNNSEKPSINLNFKKWQKGQTVIMMDLSLKNNSITLSPKKHLLHDSINKNICIVSIYLHFFLLKIKIKIFVYIIKFNKNITKKII